MTSLPTRFLFVSFSIAISTCPTTQSFSWGPSLNRFLSPSELHYRSIHHGPDVEPLTETEKLGAEYTKMDKEMIRNYGPGEFLGYTDSSDQFDGGDSDMGLTGDGTVGLKKVGRDISPHLVRTLSAKVYNDETLVDPSIMSNSNEIVHMTSEVNIVRAQQLENWAEQREISLSNKRMYERSQDWSDVKISSAENVAMFSHPVDVGGDYEGIISLRASVNGVARQDIMLRNFYMGFAEYRAAIVGNESNDWFVTPNEGVLKQTEDTQFSIIFRPKHPGVSSGYLVIETQDFKRTWKVIGSTGDQYEF